MKNLNWSKCGLFSSSSVHWSTPSDIYDFYVSDRGFFDPCPLYSSFNGLEIEWLPFNFVNPPYDNILGFVIKAIEESKKGRVSVFLVPSRTDTKWFHLLLNSCYCEIIFIKGRLKFGGAKSYAPFPSLLITIYPKVVTMFAERVEL